MEDKNKAIEPDHRVCEICNDDGKCLNNKLHPNYDEDMFGAGDIYDCVEYQERKEGKKVGSWMIDWAKRLHNRQEKEISLTLTKGSGSLTIPFKEDKSKQSSFKDWNKSLIK